MGIKKIVLDKVIWISIAIIAFLAYQDIVGARMFKTLGGFAGDAYIKMEPLYMQQFWLFAYITIGVVALTYYLIRKDKSEALALIAIPVILLWGGLEDIMYYIFTGKEFLTATMPWLENSWFMNTVAQVMGAETVTGTTLLVSAGIGIIVSYYIYGWLKKAKW